MNKKMTLVAAAALILTGITSAAQQDKNNNGKQTTAAAVRDGATPTPATMDPAYVIGPEDVLDISVWKEPDLGGSDQWHQERLRRSGSGALVRDIYAELVAPWM